MALAAYIVRGARRRHVDALLSASDNLKFHNGDNRSRSPEGRLMTSIEAGRLLSRRGLRRARFCARVKGITQGLDSITDFLGNAPQMRFARRHL
jgi:hypothetical protein